MRTTRKIPDGHQPTTSLNTSDTTKRQQKSLLANYCQTTVWLSVDRCWQPCSAVTATLYVAWRATIDAGRLVPRASRIGTLGAPSCCVEVEHSLLGELLDEQPIWRLPTVDATIDLNHPLSAGAADGRAGARRAALARATRVVGACRPPPSLAFGASPLPGLPG